MGKSIAKQTKHSAHSCRAIAAQAARLMAEDGVADFGAAKRKAARQLGFSESDAKPSDDDVEAELRTYQGLFQNNEQRSRLTAMREFALELMTELAHFQPCITGSVWNGTAGRDATVVIDLFADSMKAVEVWLMNAKIAYRVLEWPHFNRALDRKVPVLTFEQDGQTVNLVVYPVDDWRGALRSDSNGVTARGDMAALQKTLDKASASASVDEFLAAIR